MTSRTYKAIFWCPIYGERVVWFVSSRHKARKMMNSHICTEKRRLKKYRDLQEGVDYWVEVIPLFSEDPDIGVPDDFGR